jgi:aminoglycoside phosphotransferase (APT) family kinase protein
VQQPPAITPAQLHALVRAADPDWRAVRAWPLAGGVSARINGIDIERPDGSGGRLVLRQYGAANLAADPHVARAEYRLLELLHRAGLPVPWPYRADESDAILPGPWLLTGHIDGKTVTDAAGLAAFAGSATRFTGLLAQALAALHGTGVRHTDVPFLADADTVVIRRLATVPERPDDALSEAAVRAALAAHWPPARLNRPVILHGDYWPGNVLWRDGRLAGIIDWEDATFGDPLADLAVARQELWWFFGPDSARSFTGQYLTLRPDVDASALPVWDLWAALRPAGKLAGWGLSASQQASMIAAHRQFAAEALGQLGGAKTQVANPDAARRRS